MFTSSYGFKCVTEFNEMNYWMKAYDPITYISISALLRTSSKSCFVGERRVLWLNKWWETPSSIRFIILLYWRPSQGPSHANAHCKLPRGICIHCYPWPQKLCDTLHITFKWSSQGNVDIIQYANLTFYVIFQNKD